MNQNYEAMRCRKCKRDLPLTEFKVRSKEDGTFETCCKKCHAQYCYTRRLMAKYGLTPNEYYEMLNTQHGKCAICEKPITERKFTVDHDHKTGKVRGLLCFHCNTALGYLGDEVIILKRAIEYLTR